MVTRALLLVLVLAAAAPAADDPWAFWSVQRRGANLFDNAETAERLAAAKRLGVDFVRLAPDKWGKGTGRDFLMGSTDRYQGLHEGDLARLRAVLDQAARLELKVLLTFLSLPGARWRQLNGDTDDARLWRSAPFQEQAARFWRDLARRLRGHPALVGYNVLNEPHPERVLGAGAPGALDRFYRTVVSAIRSADASMPLVLDGGDYADARALARLTPLDDPRTLYAFHMYEPYPFTSHAENAGRYRYPGLVPLGDEPTPRAWDEAALDAYLQPVADWQLRHGLPAARVLAGEFGCFRRNAGAAAYLADLIRIFDRRGWHWAFYSFREDDWDGMDYEVGTGPLGEAYWAAVERGETPERPWRPNVLFEPLARAFAPRGRKR